MLIPTVVRNNHRQHLTLDFAIFFIISLFQSLETYKHMGVVGKAVGNHPIDIKTVNPEISLKMRGVWTMLLMVKTYGRDIEPLWNCKMC